jgi:hypothetical protein
MTYRQRLRAQDAHALRRRLEAQALPLRQRVYAPATPVPSLVRQLAQLEAAIVGTMIQEHKAAENG